MCPWSSSQTCDAVDLHDNECVPGVPLKQTCDAVDLHDNECVPGVPLKQTCDAVDLHDNECVPGVPLKQTCDAVDLHDNECVPGVPLKQRLSCLTDELPCLTHALLPMQHDAHLQTPLHQQSRSCLDQHIVSHVLCKYWVRTHMN